MKNWKLSRKITLGIMLIDIMDKIKAGQGMGKIKHKGKDGNLIANYQYMAIRNEKGNIRYDYFYPVNDSKTVLLIDSWENQETLDVHHGTPMMNTIFRMREKYNLHMKVERYISDAKIPETDKKFLKHRKNCNILIFLKKLHILLLRSILWESPCHISGKF